MSERFIVPVVFCFFLVLCGGRVDYVSKVTEVSSGSPDIAVIVVEQGGKDARDARERAIRIALDRVADSLLLSRYEKLSYLAHREKIYRETGLVLSERELGDGKDKVRLAITISKARLRERLRVLKILRRNIGYSHRLFSPRFLVKATWIGCRDSDASLGNSIIESMVSKIGARPTFSAGNSLPDEISKIMTDRLLSECVAHECDFLATMHLRCGREFRVSFSVLEPITSYVVASGDFSVKFPRELTYADVIEEGLYRLFDQMVEKYAAYMNSLEFMKRFLYFELERRTEVQKIERALDNSGIKTVGKVFVQGGVLMVVETQFDSDELMLFVPHILAGEGLMLRSGFRNGKFISFLPVEM